jgi:hypothetical protein
MSEPNKAFEQTPRRLGVLSIRDGRSSTPGRSKDAKDVSVSAERRKEL